MNTKMIQWYVLLIILIFISYGCQDTMSTKNQKNDETICVFYHGFITDMSRESYRISSKEGLFEVDSWIKRHIDFLHYPIQNRAVKPAGEIFTKRQGKSKAYWMFNDVPLESKEELKDIAKKYGIKISE